FTHHSHFYSLHIFLLHLLTLLLAPLFFFFNHAATTEIYTLSLHDALPISPDVSKGPSAGLPKPTAAAHVEPLFPFIKLSSAFYRSEEHTSELQSRGHLVCRLLLEKKKKKI